MLVFTFKLTLAHHGHFPQGSNRSLQVAACCWMSQMHLGTVCLCLDIPHPSREENFQGLRWSLSFSVPSKSLSWPIQPHKHQAGLTDTDITSVNLKEQNKKLNTHTNQKQNKTQEKGPATEHYENPAPNNFIRSRGLIKEEKKMRRWQRTFILCSNLSHWNVIFTFNLGRTQI